MKTVPQGFDLFHRCADEPTPVPSQEGYVFTMLPTPVAQTCSLSVSPRIVASRDDFAERGSVSRSTLRATDALDLQKRWAPGKAPAGHRPALLWLRLCRAALYRRFLTCGAPAKLRVLEAIGALPITNRRYGRLKIWATPNTYQEGNSLAAWCVKLPSLGGVGGGFIARGRNTVATGLLGCMLLVAASALAKDEPSEKKDKPKIEVCFVLDTTGSMSGLIEGAKQKIWSIANEITSAKPTPDIRIGLIGYRDRGDEYVTKAFDLTDDIDAIYGHLQAFHAAGGGDTPESVNEALHEAVNKISWSQDRKVRNQAARKGIEYGK